MDIFLWEREFWELFELKNEKFNVIFNVSSKSAVISIFHDGGWDIKAGAIILNQLWNNFKLPLSGWSKTCQVLNYNSYMDVNHDIISEYTFKMRAFQIEKLFHSEFLEYSKGYVFLILVI